MAPDDFWARKRKEEEREEEEARERAEEEARKAKKAGVKTNVSIHSDAPTAPVGDFHELIKVVPPLIEQIEQLYRQYAAGVQMRPPIEQRARLDHMMLMLTGMGRATPADKFRYDGVLNSYNTHKSRWDKMLTDIESGKIKRVAAPKKGGQF